MNEREKYLIHEIKHFSEEEFMLIGKKLEGLVKKLPSETYNDSQSRSLNPTYSQKELICAIYVARELRRRKMSSGKYTQRKGKSLDTLLTPLVGIEYYRSKSRYGNNKQLR